MGTVDRLRSVTAQAFSPALDSLAELGPFWFATLLALVAALLVLTVYRLCSTREDLHRAKSRLKAHLLELRLFQHDPVLVAQAALGAVRANFLYLRLHAKPVAILALPISLILLESQARFDRRPFLIGESIVLQSFWPNSFPGRAEEIPLVVVPPGVRLQTPPLRLSGLKEIDWRLRAERTGLYRVLVRRADLEGFVEISVSDTVGTLPGKAAYGARNYDPSGRFQLQVEHPKSPVRWSGLHLPWVWVVLLETLFFVLVLKGAFGIEL